MEVVDSRELERAIAKSVVGGDNLEYWGQKSAPFWYLEAMFMFVDVLSRGTRI